MRTLFRPARANQSRTNSAARRTSGACWGRALMLGMRRKSIRSFIKLGHKTRVAISSYNRISRSRMPPNSLRLAYMAEFLLALVSIVELWSQAGGQGHLDLMPWYTKLLLVVGLALVTVAGTASAVAPERAG